MPFLPASHCGVLPPPVHPCPAAEEMSAGLAQLGYDLEPSEVAILMQQLDIDADGQVGVAGWPRLTCVLACAATVRRLNRHNRPSWEVFAAHLRTCRRT